jgi:hypothetical protein
VVGGVVTYLHVMRQVLSIIHRGCAFGVRNKHLLPSSSLVYRVYVLRRSDDGAVQEWSDHPLVSAIQNARIVIAAKFQL